MANEKTVFECPLCGSIFDTLDAAETCERSHQTPGKIVETRYAGGEVYPRAIAVEFDGVKIFYTRG